MINNSSTLQAQQGLGSTLSARGQRSAAPAVVVPDLHRNGGLGNGESPASDAVTTEARSPHAENGRSGDPSPRCGDPVESVTTVARSGFAPPAPDSRVDLIAGLIADTKVDLDGTATDEFVAEAEAVVPAVNDIPADEALDDETPADDVIPVARADDDAPDVGDDFWAGAASEGSVPTRKIVYGAKSADSESLPPGWVKWARRRRR